MTKCLGIIGYPLGHSLSPVIHQAALDYYSLDMRFMTWEIVPSLLGEFFDGMRTSELGIRGCSVTVPHKELIAPYMDEVSSGSHRAAAINTILNNQGWLTGYNTDGAGFLRALQEETNFSPANKNVLILGAGGAARGVAMTLAAEGAGSFTVANRTVDRAKRLAKDLKKQCGKDIRAITLESSEMSDIAQGSDLIVQCTTVGMLYGADEAKTLLQAQDIPPNALVYDLVYNPASTTLMSEANKAGAQTLGGLSMLIYQGAIAFELWTGKVAPIEVMFKAAREALGTKAS